MEQKATATFSQMIFIVCNQFRWNKKVKESWIWIELRWNKIGFFSQHMKMLRGLLFRWDTNSSNWQISPIYLFILNHFSWFSGIYLQFSRYSITKLLEVFHAILHLVQRLIFWFVHSQQQTSYYTLCSIFHRNSSSLEEDELPRPVASSILWKIFQFVGCGFWIGCGFWNSVYSNTAHSEWKLTQKWHLKPKKA